MNLEGKIIGNRYEIIEKVGNGGMATVYKARDTILNRYVAVKVLRDEFTTDEEFIRRFNTEAQSAARLTHPNIVSVYDVGQEYNIYYIVMELIQGKTLKQIVSEEGALPWKWTVNIATQICSALEMAHKNGIIHRDIKPHNIIITEEGVAKVTDFGIAKAVSNSTITAFGTTLGSVHYFSPEHARGGYTDAKSDLYSLGVVMYEMVTGRVPFDADTPVSVALKHMQEEAIQPIELNERIPTALNEIILKAMKKEASERYQSATEMIKDLNMVLKDPNGNFVKQKNSDDYTRVIPVITDDMIEEDELHGNKETSSSRQSANKGKSTKDNKNAGTGFLDKNPWVRKAMYVFIPIIIVLLCILIFWGSWKITTKLLGGETTSSTIIIENVKGKTLTEAKAILDKSGIKYEVVENFSADVPEGNVISQDPEAGKSYDKEKNRAVKLIVSKGAKIVKMPNVKGKRQDEAISLIEQAELKADVTPETSQTVEEGIVIRQETEPNTDLNAGTTVKIFVSAGTGLEKVSVPYVVTSNVDDAKKKLTESKLEVNIIYEEDTSKSNGYVLKQSIEVGKVVDEGTAITLTVNKIQELKQGTININVKSLIDKYHINVESVTDDSSSNNADNKDKDKDKDKDTDKDGGNKVPATPQVSYVTLRILINDEEVLKDDKVPASSNNYNYSFKDKGVVSVKVYINGHRCGNEQMDLNSDNTVLELK